MKKDKLIRIRWLRRGSYLQVGERLVACGEECEVTEEVAAWLAEHYPGGYERVEGGHG